MIITEEKRFLKFNLTRSEIFSYLENILSKKNTASLNITVGHHLWMSVLSVTFSFNTESTLIHR